MMSVITCIRNQRLQYFAECAASIAPLGIENEWIIVDDNSLPLQAEAQRELIAKVAGRIQARLLTLRSNEGLARARNRALSVARGEWIVVVDSDDVISPDALLASLRSASPNVGLLCGRVRYFDGVHSELRPVHRFEKLFKLHGGSILDPFLWYDFYYHGIIVRRTILARLGGYPSTLSVGEDQDVLLKVAEVVDRTAVSFVHQVLYGYRDNPEGVCRTRWSEVVEGYQKTMLSAFLRRGGEAVACRFEGAKLLDGVPIDHYSYKRRDGRWAHWNEWFADSGSVCLGGRLDAEVGAC